jgi:hypothetical protein
MSSPANRQGNRAWLWLLAVLAVAVLVAGAVFATLTVTRDREHVSSQVFAANTPMSAPTATTGARVGSFEYSAMGVTARLPGEKWDRSPITGLTGSSEGELVTSADTALLFNVMRVDFDNPTSAEMSAFVGGFAKNAFTGPVQTSSADFHGYPATRTDGTRNFGYMGDYKFIQYYFYANSKINVVGVGAQIKKWESGDKQNVESILDSVRIR